MLIFTRRPGDAFYVGPHVKVVLLGVKGNQARIGIEAPKDVEVHREEIWHRLYGDDAEADGNKVDAVGDDTAT